MKIFVRTKNVYNLYQENDKKINYDLFMTVKHVINVDL